MKMSLKRIYYQLYNLSRSGKIIFFFLLILLIGAIVYFFHLTRTQIYLSGVAIAFLILVTKPIWLPDTSSPKIYRNIATIFIEIVAFFYGLWQPILNNWIKEFLLSNKIPGFLNKSPLEQYPTFLFSILLFASYTINNLLKDKTGMGKNPDPIEKDIPEPGFKERLQYVCDSLNEDLRGIDIKTNWSAQQFTPLDAEVEVQTNNGKKKKVSDLLKSIKRSKSRLFLVLGDPGGGKSVSLRKLCQDLSKEVKITGKIPIYINLKEWIVEQKWDEKHPPTIDQLNDFIFTSIKSRDIVLSKFFDKYYYRLYETGRLYFVLDSFDEIPAVLGEEENSELIKNLSAIFFKFLKGARNKDSQGILASRVFRKPTSEFQTTTTLEIRPFTEEKIIHTLKTSGVFDNELIKKIFKDRPDLVSIIRNPFMTRLLLEFIEKYPTKLPENQSELFRSYVNSTLDSCTEQIKRRGLSKDEVFNNAIEIANFIFEKYGSEANLMAIKTNLSHLKIEETIDILKFAKIGRLGSSEENLFSFSHRRFCEYFAIQKIIQDNLPLDLNAIPTDSQWRDALVLYCEVAPEEKAMQVAEFCWKTIQEINDPNNLKSIHSLRFLRDAFKGRKECISNFQNDLGNYILAQLTPNKNIISAKIAIESVNLLKDGQVNNCINQAFKLNNYWIEESAIRSCRYLSILSADLEKGLIEKIFEINPFSYLFKYDELQFSFSLSDCFARVHKKIKYKLVESILALIIIIISTLISYLCLMMVLITVFALYIYYSFDSLILPDETLLLKFKVNFLKNKKSKIKIFYTHKPLSLLSKFIRTNGGAIFLIFSTMLGCWNFFPNKSYMETYKFLSLFYLPFGVRCLIISFFSVIIVIAFINTIEIKKTSLKDFFLNFYGIVQVIAIAYVISIALNLIIINKITLDLFFFTSLIIPSFWVGAYFIGWRWYFIGKKNYRNINFSQLNQRKEIYHAYVKLDKSDYWQNKLISYIELNIAEVLGEWPDTNFLNIGHGNKKNITRLAKLEERWRRLN